MHTAKKIMVGISQFAALMFVLLFLIHIVTSRHSVTSELSPGIHTHEVSYLRVIIHDSSFGSLQFETEDHMLYAIPIVGAQPTALKPGQFANVYLRQIFEVKGSAEEKSALSSWTSSPCTAQTPCALFLQAELLQKTDQSIARNTLKLSNPVLEWR